MTDAIYEESRIYPTDKRGQRELCALLEKEGIRRDGSLEYTLIALVVIIALSFALDIFLSQYLLYRWDQKERDEDKED